MSTSREALVLRTRLDSLHTTLLEEVAKGKGVGLDGIRPSSVPSPLNATWRNECRRIQQRMRSGTYTFTPYKEVLASKGRARYPRVISIPTIRDRLTLKTLSHILHDLYGLTGPAIAQRMVGRVEAECSTMDGFVRIDLEDYFGSIDQRLLMDCLKSKIHSGAVRRLILTAIQNPTVPSGHSSDRVPAEIGIPQGLSISSVLAEIFLSELDLRWQQLPSVRYFRYVDDIVALCPIEKCESVFLELCTELHDRGLRPHPIGKDEKSSYGGMSKGFDFLGYHFSTRGTAISAQGMRKIENRIAATFGEYRRMSLDKQDRLSWLHWKISRLTCGVIFEGEHRGWIRFYSRTSDISGLHHLDAMVKKLARRSGVPSTVSLKKFVKAYHVTRCGRAFSEYIPNPAHWSPAAARTHLVNVDGWEESKVAALAPRELAFAVRRVLTRDLADLERDLDTRS